MSRPLRTRQVQDLLVDLFLFLVLAVVLLSQIGCTSGPFADSVTRACRGFDSMTHPTHTKSGENFGSELLTRSRLDNKF
jgi:hypothetical protein